MLDKYYELKHLMFFPFLFFPSFGEVWNKNLLCHKLSFLSPLILPYNIKFWFFFIVIFVIKIVS